MNTNISCVSNCYGCGVCSSSCPQNLISIELNKDGFYEPRILNHDSCVNCGICSDVCAFSHSELSNNNSSPIKSWGAWSNDENVRKKCSSGGIGYEIGKQLIEKGYQAVGCRYDVKKQRAEHYIATTVEEFIQSIGSKYIQSYTEEAFRNINRKNQKYLVTGTPCQIDSFRRMVRKFHCEDNFVLLDFFCHCVPSMHAWNAYMRMVESKIGKVSYVSWRNKFDYGWHDSWLMGIDPESVKNNSSLGDYNYLLDERVTVFQSRKSKGDLFFKLFLGDIAIGPQCEKECKYKYDHSSADIRIGDLWGKTYQGDEKGVSALVAFTEKGLKVVEDLENVTLIEHPFEIVAEGQMKRNARRRFMASIVLSMLRLEFPIDGRMLKLVLYIQRIMTKLRRTIF